jgi:hypothetical protein
MLTSNWIRCATAMALLALGCLVPQPSPGATNSLDILELARSAYQVDRKAFVADNLQLSEEESKDFWPLYDQYRQAVEKCGDGLIKLVLEYADSYPDVPESKARELIDDYLRLEAKAIKLRRTYATKFRRILPATKVARLLQIENRLDLGVRMQLATAVPMVPTARP